MAGRVPERAWPGRAGALGGYAAGRLRALAPEAARLPFDGFASRWWGVRARCQRPGPDRPDRRPPPVRQPRGCCFYRPNRHWSRPARNVQRDGVTSSEGGSGRDPPRGS